MPPSRARRVVPPAEETATDSLLGEVPEAFTAPRRSRSQARRVQAATTPPKLRVPEDQRAVEVADGELVVLLAGKPFRLAESISLMSLMEFAAAASEVDAGNSAQLVSFYHVLQDVVHSDDFAAFCRHARVSKCGDDELITFQNAAIEAIAARPTRAPATS